MRSTKTQTTYAFIDSQNLNLGVRSQGWQLDFAKFYIYLKNKFRIKKAFLFIGYVPSNKKLYRLLKNSGYKLIFKPTIIDGQGTTKGNVDAELVLWAGAREYDNYDKAVVVSGDGDFYCLYEYLEENNKLKRIIIPSQRSESSLLKKFHSYKTFLSFDRAKLELRGSKIKSGRRRS